MFWEEKIGINVLRIDENNPRLPTAINQQVAIDQMLGSYEIKIKNIARHISINGLNPSTVPIVFYTSEGKYIVKDGNRRVTAIKCLMYPSKIKNNPALKKYFTRLNKTIDRKLFQRIDCKVSNDEDEINQWVEINHQGEQDGIGQSKWDSVAKARHMKSIGQSQPNLDLFDYLIDKLPHFFDDEIDFTTFERMIKNAAFKNAIGMEITENEIIFNRSEEEWLHDFEELFSDMISSKDSEDHVDSRTMNTVHDVEEYVKNKRAKGFFKHAGSPEESLIPINIKLLPPDTGSKKRKKRTSRKVLLIEADCEINFPKPRMNDMFRDLKKFDLRNHSNSASAIFRTLFEMSTKYYHEKMPKPENEASDRNTPFPDRIRRILKHLRENKMINKDTKISVELLLENQDPIVQEFAQFGHNYEYNPTHDSLKNLWNSLETFMMAMYPCDEDIEESAKD